MIMFLAANNSHVICKDLPKLQDLQDLQNLQDLPNLQNLQNLQNSIFAPMVEVEKIIYVTLLVSYFFMEFLFG